MRKCALFGLLLMLANAGCWECCQLCHKNPVATPAPTQSAAEAKPAKQSVITADQVNRQNAHEIAENLRLEIDHEAK